jgi:hypothetical protein
MTILGNVDIYARRLRQKISAPLSHHVLFFTLDLSVLSVPL